MLTARTRKAGELANKKLFFGAFKLSLPDQRLDTTTISLSVMTDFGAASISFLSRRKSLGFKKTRSGCAFFLFARSLLNMACVGRYQSDFGFNIQPLETKSLS
jgi:hypothetical protein